MQENVLNDLISIIVPVYNVESYLEKCIKSIIRQTYTNLELLLINDGSDDSSEQRCLKWAKADSRIIYVYKKNESLGPTRNLGIQMARGKYIAFVDSDDWVDSLFVEKMYAKAKADNSDIVRCDYYRVNGNRKTILNNNEYYPFDQLNIHKMIGSAQAITVWTGLYKKEVWTENDIKMPAGPHQDLAILGLPFLYARKISVCREGLYFYREDRAGNTTLKVAGTDSVLKPLRHLVGEYKKRNLFDEYKKELLQVCIGRLNTSINRFTQGKEYRSKQEYAKNIRIFLRSELGVQDGFFNNKMVAIGGYDLQRVFSGIHYNENIEDYKYQHSSVISFMANTGEFSIEEEKTYRGKMIEADGNKKLKTYLKNYDIDYVLLDFIEERYDILDFGHQRYLTYSDALREQNLCIDNARIIKRESEECEKIWKSSCTEFIKLLKKRVKNQNIFLVKFFLAEGYGEYGKEREYDDIDKIQRINALLNKYYVFFEENFQGIHVIEMDKKYCFTDEGLKYGCYPWHLNTIAQYDARSQINNFMKDEGKE